MSKIAVQKVNDKQTQPVPALEEIGRRMQAIERRAFELFQQGGCCPGHDLDDWLRAEHEVLGWPSAELTAQDEAFEIQMTLPGFQAKEVEVTATPDEIVVHAEAKHEEMGEDRGVVWTEFGSNDVYRRFDLPAQIDVDKATATLENGILHVKAPQSVKRAASATAAA